jgi:3-oxoacyl-[acyl-carrier protein] reductase
MSDFLLELSQNPTAKKFIQAAGLPLPLPTPLDRPKGPTTEQILKDQPVFVGGEGELTELLAQIVVQAGAEPFVQGDKLFKAFDSVGEAYGRRPTKLVADEVPAGVKGKVFLFDATGLKSPADLRQIYDFLKPRARAVAKSGRVVIISRPTDEATTPAEAAARAGIDGFVRSLGKELGGGGSTANVIYVQAGVEARLAATLRFFM